MIDKKELRIGNLIYNGIGEVIEVNGSTISYFELAADVLGEFKPIPLTEEWLLDFGFEGDRQPYIKYPFEFFIDDIGNCSCYYKGHCLCIFSYVHQLQNLIFSLCGEELTLPPPPTTN